MAQRESKVKSADLVRTFVAHKRLAVSNTPYYNQ